MDDSNENSDVDDKILTDSNANSLSYQQNKESNDLEIVENEEFLNESVSEKINTLETNDDLNETEHEVETNSISIKNNDLEIEENEKLSNDTVSEKINTIEPNEDLNETEHEIETKSITYQENKDSNDLGVDENEDPSNETASEKVNTMEANETEHEIETNSITYQENKDSNDLGVDENEDLSNETVSEKESALETNNNNTEILENESSKNEKIEISSIEINDELSLGMKENEESKTVDHSENNLSLSDNYENSDEVDANKISEKDSMNNKESESLKDESDKKTEKTEDNEIEKTEDNEKQNRSPNIEESPRRDSESNTTENNNVDNYHIEDEEAKDDSIANDKAEDHEIENKQTEHIEIKSETLENSEKIGNLVASEIQIDNKSVSTLCENVEDPKIVNTVENVTVKTSTVSQTQTGISSFFTVHIQLDDGTIKNQIVTIIKNKNKKPFLGGFRHKLSGIEYHNAAVQTKPKPRPPPSVELFSRDTQTFQIRHQKINTNNTTSTQMAGPGVYVSNISDSLIIPGKYETADEYQDRILNNIIIIQKYYRRWLAKHIVDEKRRQRDQRVQWEQQELHLKQKEKEERIKKEYERRMHPKTRADFDLLYNGLEKWRQERMTEIESSSMGLPEKKAAKLALLEEETDLLAAIDRHKIDRKQETKSEEVQKLLGKAAAPKSWKDIKGRKIQMDTPYTIRSRELLDILNSLNMQYLTQDERLDVLLTLKHTVKEHDCKLTRDIIDLVDREADLIMRNTKDNNLVGLRKRIITLFLQYCKTPTFNPEISLLLKVPPDPSVLIGDINYCKYCGRYLRSTEFSLSTKSSKLTICKSCARKENQSRKRQDYSHYRRILKDLQMYEQQCNDNSKIAFIFKQNDIKTLMESVWDNKSIISECEDLDELIFVRWNFREQWSPWNTILLTKDESDAHNKVTNTSEIYSDVMINRINQKHVIARNMYESLEKMIEEESHMNKSIK